jgi:tricorn protease-like protein
VRTKRDNVTQALFSIGIDGNGLRPLLPYTLVVGTHLDWSPDGKRIAVTIGANLAPRRSANVATVDLNAKNLRWVTRFKGGVRNAFVGGYSPDGRWLVIRIDQRVMHGLYLVHPDGTALHRIYVSRNIERGIDWGKGT